MASPQFTYVFYTLTRDVQMCRIAIDRQSNTEATVSAYHECDDNYDGFTNFWFNLP
jgi:hypothetical protein